jgi:hypothetical protein
MFLVKNASGRRRANNAKNDTFIALTRTGVGPGVKIESHNEVAAEAILNEDQKLRILGFRIKADTPI